MTADVDAAAVLGRWGCHMPDIDSGGGVGGAVIERIDGIRLPTFYSLQRFMESRNDVPFLVGEMASAENRIPGGPAVVRCALNQYAIVSSGTIFGLIEPGSVTFYMGWGYSSRIAEAFMRATVLNRHRENAVIQFATGGGAYVRYDRNTIEFTERRFLRDECGFFRPAFDKRPSHPCETSWSTVRRACEMYQGGAHYRDAIAAAAYCVGSPVSPQPVFAWRPMFTSGGH